jgi:hypothetical protein
MSKGGISAVERIIANTINETARGDPDDLAARIVAALTEAGFRVVSAHGKEDTAPGPQRAETRQLYRSPPVNLPSIKEPVDRTTSADSAKNLIIFSYLESQGAHSNLP